MKKFAKLSLAAVAALAVSANAGALEDAVKNTDISGKVYVEYIGNDNNAAGSKENTSDIDVDITFKTKVNDNVTAVVRAQADAEDDTLVGTKGNSTAGATTVDNVYFTYVNGDLTAMAGKMDINTPNTDGEIGTGLLVSYNAGVATLVGGTFHQTEVTALGDDVSAAAVLGSVGPVNAEAWYISTKDADHITLVVAGNVGPVSGEVRYATTDVDGSNLDRNTLKLTVGADLGVASLTAIYFDTDELGATTTDPTSLNAFESSQLGTTGAAKDIEAYFVGVSVPVGPMTYSVDYAAYEDATNADLNETRLTAKYKMSKNFHVQARYSIYKDDNTSANDNNSARLEAKYSF